MQRKQSDHIFSFLLDSCGACVQCIYHLVINSVVFCNLRWLVGTGGPVNLPQTLRGPHISSTTSLCLKRHPFICMQLCSPTPVNRQIWILKSASALKKKKSLTAVILNRKQNCVIMAQTVLSVVLLCLSPFSPWYQRLSQPIEMILTAKTKPIMW